MWLATIFPRRRANADIVDPMHVRLGEFLTAVEARRRC